MSSITHVIIAAAGLGSRLGFGLPKCLVEIEGRTLIERQLQLLDGIADIRVVVGYMEHAVIEAVTRLNRRAVFVRNPDFRTTTTQDSYARGAQGLCEKCLFLDADIVFDAISLESFLKYSESHLITIGVTSAKTDEAIYAVTRSSRNVGDLEIVSFSDKPSPYEWANIVAAPANSFHFGRGPVYQTLQTLLPAAAKEIVSFEIDTERDLRRAEEFLLRGVTATGTGAF